MNERLEVSSPGGKQVDVRIRDFEIATDQPVKSGGEASAPQPFDYCVRAKHLLECKGIEFDEIRIDTDREQMQIMMKCSRRHTVPQIFIDDFHVGGFDDLATLEVRGELDPLLGR